MKNLYILMTKSDMKDAWRYWVDQDSQEKDRTELPKCELMQTHPTTKKAEKWAHVVPNPQPPCMFGTSAENIRGTEYIVKKTQGWDDFGAALSFIVKRQPPFN